MKELCRVREEWHRGAPAQLGLLAISSLVIVSFHPVPPGSSSVGSALMGYESVRYFLLGSSDSLGYLYRIKICLVGPGACEICFAGFLACDICLSRRWHCEISLFELRLSEICLDRF